MKKTLLVISIIALVTSSTGRALAAQASPDFAKLNEARLQFQADESAQKEAAAKRYLLNAATKLDGNQADYDINYYGVHVSLNFTNSSIVAAIDYQFTSLVPSLNNVDLNLHDQLQVDSVIYLGGQIPFSHIAGILSVSLTTPVSESQQAFMTVYYHGYPVTGGGYTDGGMQFDNHYGNTICWTSVEPYNARNWWPCKDTPSDKADSLEMWIECPSGMYAASNGVLLETTPAGAGRTIYHWKSHYPITTYLVALSVAAFNITTKTWVYDGHTMPVYAFNYPNAYETIACYDTLVIPVLNHYSDAYGIYPFVNEKLGNADCGTWGTMEHQTCSFHDPFSGYSKEYLVIHENAHQWWGDMITCKTFHDVWLNEGFGTFSEAIFYEKQYNSKQVYLDYMQLLKHTGATGSVYVEDPQTEVIFDGVTSYDKGAWVVHMLRGVLGDNDFFQFLHDWAFSSFRYGSATTADLSDFCSNWTGTDMSWFFNEWIHQPSNPSYTYATLCQPNTADGGYNFYLRIQQTQTHFSAYTMPIKFKFYTTGGTIDTSVFNHARDQFYQFHFADSVTSVAFDPDEWILRTVQQVAMGTYVPTICPDAVRDEPYYYEVPVIGGTPPYTWAFLGGDIPYGLSYTDGPSFVLSGTPTYPATYYMNVRVVDSSNPPITTDKGIALTVVEQSFVCGDADGSGQVAISDAVFVINYIFGGGPAPDVQTADADCSGSVTIGDAVYLINYIFGGGLQPCAGC